MKNIIKFPFKTNQFILLFLSLLFFFSLNSSSIAENYGQLIKKLNSVKGIEKVDILNKLSYNLTQNNFDSSANYAIRALKLSQSLKYKNGEIFALCNLGFAKYLKGAVKEANSYYINALTKAQKVNYYFGQVYAFIGLALIDWRETKYKSASTYLNQAIAIASKYKINELLGRAYSYSGLIYWKWSDYTKAIELYFKALSIKEKVGDDFETAVTLNNIAYVYNEIKDFKKSMIYSTRAEKIGKKIKNDFVLGRAYSNKSMSYLGLKDYKTSLKFNELSLKLKLKNSDKRGIGFSYLDNGNINLELNNYEKALSDFNKAYKYMNQTDDSYGKSLALFKIGEAYLKINNFTKAKSNFFASMSLAEKNNFKSILAINYLQLSNLYQNINDLSTSLKYIKKYYSISDSLNKEKNAAKISEMQLKYEIDKTSAENEALKIKNEIQKLQLEKNSVFVHFLIGIAILLTTVIFVFYSRNKFILASKQELEEKNREIESNRKKLEEANASKDKFLSIISHDLRNPFQALMGYVNLLLTDYHNLSDKERLYYISEIDSAIKSTLQLVENLLNWGRAQAGKLDYNPIIVNLKQIVTETVLQLLAVAKRKNISLENLISDDDYVFIDVYFLQTILRNLISNSIKFTQTNGSIKIYSEMIDNQKTIVVEDTGIGMSEDTVNSLFNNEENKSRLGTNREKGTGLGLTLCHEFVKKYDGKIWVESQLGKGSKFYFTVPIE